MDRKIKGDKRFPAAIDDKPKKKIAKKKTKSASRKKAAVSKKSAKK